MTDGEQSIGRPTKGSERGKETRKFTIVLDDEVDVAIKALAGALDPDVRRGRRSIAVRKAILDAFQKIR